MRRYVRHLEAAGVDSVGGGMNARLELWATVDRGLKGVIGRRVKIRMEPKDIAFVLASLAYNQPDVFRAITAELGDHRQPRPGRGHDFALARRLTDSVIRSLTDSTEQADRA
jgi:hypothetical protein